MIRGHKMVVEEIFPMSEQGYSTGKLSDDTKSQILLDTAVSKSFMSKSHCLCGKSLHLLLNLHQRHKEFKWVMDNM